MRKVPFRVDSNCCVAAIDHRWCPSSKLINPLKGYGCIPLINPSDLTYQPLATTWGSILEDIMCYILSLLHIIVLQVYT